MNRKLTEPDLFLTYFRLRLDFNDNYPIHESNLHQNYFACELNCVASRYNSTAIYLNI